LTDRWLVEPPKDNDASGSCRACVVSAFFSTDRSTEGEQLGSDWSWHNPLLAYRPYVRVCVCVRARVLSAVSHSLMRLSVRPVDAEHSV